MAVPSDSPNDPTRTTTPVLVSACLLGQPCRYDGKSKLDSGLEEELRSKNQHAVAFCPEESGGLATPRSKAWIGSKNAAAVWAGDAELVTENGGHVTAEFKRGAQLALEQCSQRGITTAYMKERSPSCGVRQTHVDGQLVEGPGDTSALLAQNGIHTCGR